MTDNFSTSTLLYRVARHWEKGYTDPPPTDQRARRMIVNFKMGRRRLPPPAIKDGPERRRRDGTGLTDA